LLYLFLSLFYPISPCNPRVKPPFYIFAPHVARRTLFLASRRLTHVETVGRTQHFPTQRTWNLTSLILMYGPGGRFTPNKLKKKNQLIKSKLNWSGHLFPLIINISNTGGITGSRLSFLNLRFQSNTNWILCCEQLVCSRCQTNFHPTGSSN
jgi:hypothetical protein